MEIIIDNIKYDVRAEERGAYVIANYNYVSDGEFEYFQLDKYKGDVVIPAEIQVDGLTIPVIGIEMDAFYACDDVTSVTLPEGLRIIKRSAFESMSGIKEIVIPESVEKIGECAFSDCENLQKVVLPAGLKHLPAELFESCGSLEDVVMPAGLKTIGDGCFAACAKLQKIVLPEGLEKIDSRAFDMCMSLQDVQIPATVKEIGEAAFYSCISLRRIVLPEGVEYVPVDCFAMCQRLTDVVIPSSVKMVEEGAFDLTPYRRNGIHYVHDLLVTVGTPEATLVIKEGTRVVCDTAVSDYDNKLKKVICPASLRQIGRNAFRNSESLEEVVLNEGLEYLDGGAFDNCKRLKRIYIPSTVKRIEANPFCCCDMLEEIVVSPYNPYFDSRNGCNAIMETASNRLIAACKTTIIPEDTEVIGVAAFAGIESLEQVSIPESVKRIEWNAFNGCKNLSEVLVSDKLSYVGEGAFDGTAWLEAQPQGMVIVGKVLYAYKPITEYGVEPDCRVPEGILTITDWAFSVGDYTMRVYLPKSLKYFHSSQMHFGSGGCVFVKPDGVGDDYPYQEPSYS